MILSGADHHDQACEMHNSSPKNDLCEMQKLTVVKSKEFLHPKKKKTTGGWGARRLSSMKKILKFWDIFIYKCIYFNFFL